MDNSFKNLIDSAQEVLILLPSKPFTDQVAGGLALYLSLVATGKTVSISCPAPMITEFSRLIGVDKISSDLGNKNLVISLKNYDANSVDKVSYDIIEGQFKLTISPKAGQKSPTKEQLDINYSGASGDLVILIGGANDSHFPALTKEEFKSAKLVHIGTRLLEILNSDLQVLSFARPASSTSELVANLVKESEFAVYADIATNLLAGIEDQSKGFQSSDVTADTFTIFAELLNLGGKRMPKLVPAKSYPVGAIPNQPYNKQSQPVQASTVAKFMDANKEDVKAIEEVEKETQPVPPSWSEPKIFTGTSLS